MAGLEPHMTRMVAVLICAAMVLLTLSVVLPRSQESAAAQRFEFGGVPPSDPKPVTLTSPLAQSGGLFGLPVAVGSKTVVVGALGETASGYSDAGHAYVLRATTGALISTLSSPNSQTDGWFGSAVAISGNDVVIGAYDENASGYDGAGNAYIFDATTGALVRTLTSPNAQAGGAFGSAVAISGTTVVVGAPEEYVDRNSEAGHAYVFDATTGALLSTLTSPNEQAAGRFGDSVAISGTTAVVGAWEESVSGLFVAGHAYVFKATTGALVSTLTSPNPQTDGQFGFSVTISGAKVVVGAWLENASGLSQAGHAYVFKATTGALISTLTSPKPQTRGFFGSAVAISGSTIVVGARNETSSGYGGAGVAYVFNATTSALVHTLRSPNSEAQGYFGTAVAIRDSRVVVGAPFETAAGYAYAGHAYVFENE